MGGGSFVEQGAYMAGYWAGAAGVALLAVFGLALSALMVAAWCMIVRRAGYPWPFGLLVAVPLVNFIAVAVVAFSTWPIERELRLLRGKRP